MRHDTRRHSQIRMDEARARLYMLDKKQERMNRRTTEQLFIVLGVVAMCIIAALVI